MAFNSKYFSEIEIKNALRIKENFEKSTNRKISYEDQSAILQVLSVLYFVDKGRTVIPSDVILATFEFEKSIICY